MLLLYPEQASHTSAIDLHLHSTMLLLYLGLCTGAGVANVNLHSTMLLLYPLTPIINHYPDRIYIPLCFYFIITDSQFIQACKLIYIPLCFYFIAWRPYANKGGTRIYIPLCFYFIRPESHLSFLLFLIYIPLCFYFILPCIPQRCEVQLDLHSTMLLLYPQTGIAAAAAVVYLHSTMLLLYHMRHAFWCYEHLLFTFHYASTLSEDRLHVLVLRLHLHSTMLLLYPIAPMLVSSELCSFTFHYASTLSMPCSQLAALPSSFTFHYASTLSKEEYWFWWHW